MKLRIVSDLHLEFGPLTLEPPKDPDTYLILAGDIGLGEFEHTYIPFLQDVSQKFKQVFYIPGNHEYYRGRFPDSWAKIVAHPDMPKNVCCYNHALFLINGIWVWMGTLWSDFNHDDPVTKEFLRNRMNDFRVVENLSPDIAYEENQKSTNLLRLSLKNFPERMLVITHHAPSPRSIPEKYKQDNYMNGGYVNHLDELIEETQPLLWVHGHTHDSFDYYIGETRILCNPRGYDGRELNPNFDPNLTIEVSHAT